MGPKHIRTTAMAGAALLLGAPALADVKAGVDAWARGDYAVAVGEWRAPAASGDADAQFNLAQAYRLGRGVEQDTEAAEALYAKAAAQGHIKAADNYGLVLFEGGQREKAMPYLQGAAGRGDPRAQYLLGIAHFNGDLLQKDWVRAYALLTLANAAGLPQAAPAIRQMDQHIPLEQRQQAQSLAAQLKRESDVARASQLAAADLGADAPAQTATPPARVAAVQPPRTLPSPAARVPQPIREVPVSPSVTAAEAAVAEAMRVTGTESPANAGADFARPAALAAPAAAPAPASAPNRVASAAPARAAPAPKPAPVPAPASSSGPWRVQLGAFGVAGNAEKLWRSLSSRSELAGKSRLLVPAGRLTKLQAGGFGSQSAAQAACDGLKRSGQACIVTRD